MKKKCIFCYISVSQERRDSAYNILYTYQPSSYIDLRRTRDRFDVHMKLSLLQYCVWVAYKQFDQAYAHFALKDKEFD